MHRIKKRVISLLLAFIMLFSTTTVSFADIDSIGDNENMTTEEQIEDVTEQVVETIQPETKEEDKGFSTFALGDTPQTFWLDWIQPTIVDENGIAQLTPTVEKPVAIIAASLAVYFPSL